MSLGPPQDMFTRRRVAMFLLHMGDERVRELFGVVARKGPLATRAPQHEILHGHQSRRPIKSANGERIHQPPRGAS